MCVRALPNVHTYTHTHVRFPFFCFFCFFLTFYSCLQECRIVKVTGASGFTTCKPGNPAKVAVPDHVELAGVVSLAALLIGADDVALVGHGSHHSCHTPTCTHTCGRQPLGGIRSVCCVGRDLRRTSDPGSLRATLLLIRTPARRCVSCVSQVSACVPSSGRLRCRITVVELVALGDHYY